jgi:acetoacetate decarboxylase
MEALDQSLSLGGFEAIVEPGPWHYGVDYVAGFFKASRAELQRLLPSPLKVKDGTCVVYVSEFVSVSEKRPEAIFQSPESTIYREAAIGIGCKYRDKPGIYFPIMWVDKDWSLMRGLMNGYAKRMADEITMTKLHPLNPALKPLGAGTTLSGYCVKDGRRVISVTLTIQRRGEPSELVNFGATFGVRRFPRTQEGQREVFELVEVQKYNIRVGDVWLGEAKIRVPGITELPGFEPLFGARYQAGFSIRGAKVLRRLRGAGASSRT